MKRKMQNSGVYEFLEQSGALKNGSVQEIAIAKKEYWREYKKRWKNKLRAENKSFEVVFSESEVKKLQVQASKQKISVTKFIKYRALSEMSTSPVLVGRIRELLMNEYNEIEQMLEAKGFCEDDIERILSKVLETEANILALLC